jgi:hypothetical protein
MLDCVRIAFSMLLVHFDSRLSGDLPPYKYWRNSNKPTVCLRFPQYVIRFTELWMARC